MRGIERAHAHRRRNQLQSREEVQRAFALVRNGAARVCVGKHGLTAVRSSGVLQVFQRVTDSFGRVGPLLLGDGAAEGHNIGNNCDGNGDDGCCRLGQGLDKSKHLYPFNATDNRGWLARGGLGSGGNDPAANRLALKADEAPALEAGQVTIQHVNHVNSPESTGSPDGASTLNVDGPVHQRPARFAQTGQYGAVDLLGDLFDSHPSPLHRLCGALLCGLGGADAEVISQRANLGITGVVLGRMPGPSNAPDAQHRVIGNSSRFRYLAEVASPGFQPVDDAGKEVKVISHAPILCKSASFVNANLHFSARDTALMATPTEALALNLKRLTEPGGKFGSHTALAKIAGVEQSTVSRWIKKQNAPSLDKLEKIAAAAECSVQQLISPKEEWHRFEQAPPTPFGNLSAYEASLITVIRGGLSPEEIASLTESVNLAIEAKRNGGTPGGTHEAVKVYFGPERRTQVVSVPQDRRDGPVWKVDSTRPKRPPPPKQQEGAGEDQT